MKWNMRAFFNTSSCICLIVSSWKHLYVNINGLTLKFVQIYGILKIFIRGVVLMLSVYHECYKRFISCILYLFPFCFVRYIFPGSKTWKRIRSVYATSILPWYYHTFEISFMFYHICENQLPHCVTVLPLLMCMIFYVKTFIIFTAHIFSNVTSSWEILFIYELFTTK